MDSDAYFRRHEERSAPTPLCSEQLLSHSDGQRPQNVLFESLRATAMDDAYFQCEVQCTTPTMARPAGRDPH